MGKIGATQDGGVTATPLPASESLMVEDAWWLKPPGHLQLHLIHFSDATPVPNAAIGRRAWVGGSDYSGRHGIYLIQGTRIGPTTPSALPEKRRDTMHSPKVGLLSGQGRCRHLHLAKDGHGEVWTPDKTGCQASSRRKRCVKQVVSKR